MAREDEYQLVETCRRLSNLGMMPASDGNCSLRLDDEEFLITPTGVRKEQLKPQDLVHVKITADQAPATASSEWRMHAAFYQAQAAIGGIVHAHPAYLTILGIRELIPETSLLYETRESIGRIALIGAEQPGTPQFADHVVDNLSDATVGLMKHHGAISVGATIEEALFRMERAEHLAQITVSLH